MPDATDGERRKVLSHVALGNVPPDIVMINGTLFNVFTREFVKNQSIWIKDGMIAYAGPDQTPSKNTETLILDADGMVLLPGLIEGHTHMVSNRYGIEEFVKHVISTGVTTVITETMELAAIAGEDGIKYPVRGLMKQPIRFYYTIPPLCGLTSAQEGSAPTNEELLPLLKDPKCLGLGEIYWSNLLLQGNQGERVRELASISLGLDKRVEGHTAGASGRKLQAYSDFGISSCHEPITKDEVLERLRLGYWVMIREGSIRKELEGVKGIFKKKIDFRRLILSTDGVDPEDFLEEGYLDASLRRAMKLGVPPALAYQMVTINVAEHFHLDHLIGSLSPGKMADIVMIPSKDVYSPQLVMCGGQIIFKDGRSTVAPHRVSFPDHLFHTVKLLDFNFPSVPRKGNARAMELVTGLVTKETIIDLGKLEQSKDVLKLLAMERTGHGGAFMGLLKGFGLRQGAYGSTMCWDTTDMIVAGCDRQSMETVITRLKEIEGGGVYAIGAKVVAEFPAPLCGLLSLKPMEIVRDEIKHLEQSLRDHGVRLEKPCLTIDTLTTPAIPHLRITHQGYVRLKDRMQLSLEV
ncbi:MAG: adenine deaminase C-terminal domain-containing protein [Thermodesulfobacteriota bacterium]